MNEQTAIAFNYLVNELKLRVAMHQTNILELT